jgi:precorrin-2 dehydrogenase/sirohydrochlorin ferrochelatase
MMRTAAHYPIFVNLHGRQVLVAGAGTVALRKTLGLVEAGAEVTVVAPEIDPAFEKLPVTLVRRQFRPSDLHACMLVFAATDDRTVNRRIGVAARKLSILANIADRAEECDFMVPARVTSGTVQIAISTGGRSPRLAKELRKKLEQIL